MQIEDLYLDVSNTLIKWNEELIDREELVDCKEKFERRERDILRRCGGTEDFPLDSKISEEAMQTDIMTIENRFGGKVTDTR